MLHAQGMPIAAAATKRRVRTSTQLSMTISRGVRLPAVGLAVGLGLLMLLPIALRAQPARANVIRVCPTCAHKSVWGAVSDAFPGDTVLVEAGTYVESNSIFPRMSVTVTSEAGAEHTVLFMHVTRPLFVFTGVEDEPRRVLSGFTIVAHPDAPTDRGGAIYIGNRSKPLIAQNVFSDCVALRRGGAICIENDLTQPWIEDNRFVACHVAGDSTIGGGAIFIQDGVPVITGNLFLENHSDKEGGALYIKRERETPRQAKIANNQFDGNTAGGSGGAIYALDSKPWIRGNTFVGNISSGGGAVYLNQCNDAAVEGNTFRDNRVLGVGEFSAGGGLAMFNTTRARVDSNVLRLNQASKGGGLYIENAAGSACVVSNNVLGDNGRCELMIENASPHVVNNTLLGTTVSANRVGVDVLGSSARPSIVNNLITGQAYGVRASASAAPALAHNDLYQNVVASYAGLAPAASDLSVDPQLVDGRAGDWHLREASPLIDAGVDETAPSHDADGDPRPLDGNGDGLAAVDIGADEHSAAHSTPTATTTPSASPTVTTETTPTATPVAADTATMAPTDTPTASPTASSPAEATPTATATGTAAPSDTPPPEPTATGTPGFTPTPMRVMHCLRRGNLWNDEFEDPGLPLWQVDWGLGYARFQASVMDLGVQTLQDRFPLMWTRLPCAGDDYALELRFRYGNPTARATGVGLGSAAYDGARYVEGSTPPSSIEDVLCVQQTNAGLSIRLLGRVGWTRPAPDTAWHVLRLSREGAAYTLALDGRQMGSVPHSEVTAQSLYIGSPLITRSADSWTAMQIDYVRLQGCNLWGAERLWLPLILRGR